MYSFIVPIYKAESYLKECIESIVNQTIDDWELLLIDDGSPDGCGAICDAYAKKDSRIKAIHQENSGVSAARNNGIEHAKGDWIFFVDADDWVEPNLCETLSEVITDEMDMIFFTYKEERQNNAKDFSTILGNEAKVTLYTKKNISVMQKAILDKHLCKFTSVGSPWAKAYRTSLIKDNHIVYETGMVKGEDHLFNLIAYEHASAGAYINEALYHYRITETSARHKYNPEIIPIIQKQYRLIHKFIEDYNKTDFKEVYYSAVFRRFMIDSMIDFCHADNKKRYSVRKKEYIGALKEEPFATAIRMVSLKGWPLQERILGFCVKHHMFAVICILYDLKNKMFKAHK